MNLTVSSSKSDFSSTTNCDQIHKYRQSILATLFVPLKSDFHVQQEGLSLACSKSDFERK